MTPTFHDIYEAALALSPDERTDLADLLYGSIDAPDEHTIDPQLADEVRRRIKEVDSGRVKLVPWAHMAHRLNSAVSSAPPPNPQ